MMDGRCPDHTSAVPELPSRSFFSKEFFDLQFSFAEKVACLSRMSLARALFEYTNFYVRFGLGRNFDAEHASWRAYLAGLRGASDGREWTYRFYLKDAEATTAPPIAASVGCFSYAFQGQSTVRLHLRNADAELASPLGAARFEQRRAELTALFEHLKSSTEEDVTVTGASWLYNLDAYRRLFPAAYTSSRRVLRNRFRSMTLWGQFIDHRGQIKQPLQGSFASALAEHSAVADLDDCFPLKVLAVEAPVRHFYDHYAI